MKLRHALVVSILFLLVACGGDESTSPKKTGNLSATVDRQFLFQDSGTATATLVANQKAQIRFIHLQAVDNQGDLIGDIIDLFIETHFDTQFPTAFGAQYKNYGLLKTGVFGAQGIFSSQSTEFRTDTATSGQIIVEQVTQDNIQGNFEFIGISDTGILIEVFGLFDVPVIAK